MARTTVPADLMHNIISVQTASGPIEVIDFTEADLPSEATFEHAAARGEGVDARGSSSMPRMAAFLGAHAAPAAGTGWHGYYEARRQQHFVDEFLDLMKDHQARPDHVAMFSKQIAEDPGRTAAELKFLVDYVIRLRMSPELKPIILGEMGSNRDFGVQQDLYRQIADGIDRSKGKAVEKGFAFRAMLSHSTFGDDLFLDCLSRLGRQIDDPMIAVGNCIMILHGNPKLAEGQRKMLVELMQGLIMKFSIPREVIEGLLRNLSKTA
jgi:hypothetical protein